VLHPAQPDERVSSRRQRVARGGGRPPRSATGAVYVAPIIVNDQRLGNDPACPVQRRGPTTGGPAAAANGLDDAKLQAARAESFGLEPKQLKEPPDAARRTQPGRPKAAAVQFPVPDGQNAIRAASATRSSSSASGSTRLTAVYNVAAMMLGRWRAT